MLFLKASRQHLQVDELIRKYIRYLRDERNASAHTLRNYLSDLNQFQEFLRNGKFCLEETDKIDERKIDIHVARAYLASLSKKSQKDVHRAQASCA